MLKWRDGREWVKRDFAGREKSASSQPGQRFWFERDKFDLFKAVRLLQMRVAFHQQRAAVFVSKPLRHGWHWHAAFNRASREVVTQGMMMKFRQA